MQQQAILDAKKLFWKEAQEKFNQEHQSLLDEIKMTDDAIDEFKNLIRHSAEEEFTATGNKKLLGGIGIREYKDINYDEKEAFKWALENKLCLNLDTKAFEKIATTQNEVPITETIRIAVTFPKEIKIEVAKQQA